MLISEDAFKKDKWNITWNITDFRNIKNIKFKFIRGGITIIVGENNIGKTNILDYIYEENKEWDKFQVNKESYIEEETREGLIPSYREPFPLFDLFFSRRFNLIFSIYGPNRYKTFPSKIIHAFHPQFVEKPKESKMILSYKVYYFDLTASSSFLIREKNKDLSLKRVKFRSCEIHYGKSESGNKKMKRGMTEGEKYFMLESQENPEEKNETWVPRFSVRGTNFIKGEENGKITYWGFNKNVFHPLDKLGSGYLKYETINSLLEDLKKEKKFQQAPQYKTTEGNWKAPTYPKHLHIPILLIDEPEIFLHHSLVSKLAENLKKTKEENVTTVLTTHSPTFLSHFVNELFTGTEPNLVNLVIVRKDKNGNLDNPLNLGEIVESIRKEVTEGSWNKYCPCFEEKMKNDKEFYYNKWKTLLNEHTLKIFFSKKILFVEGITEYVLFTSSFMKREIPALEEIEVIPIFGKFNYIFFSRLSNKLGIKSKFLLDKDNELVEKAEKIEKSKTEKERIKGTKLKGCDHEPEKCIEEQLHKNFWDMHRGKKLVEKKGKIIHDKEGEIDWFKEDVEDFLETVPKRTFVVSKDLAMLSSVESMKELKKSDPVKVKKWKDRAADLKEVIKKLI